MANMEKFYDDLMIINLYHFDLKEMILKTILKYFFHIAPIKTLPLED